MRKRSLKYKWILVNILPLYILQFTKCHCINAIEHRYKALYQTACEKQRWLYTHKELIIRWKISPVWFKEMEYIPWSQFGRIDIVKITLLPKAVYKFNVIPIKLSMKISPELEQIILKFMWKDKRPRIARAVLRKQSWRHSPFRL